MNHARSATLLLLSLLLLKLFRSDQIQLGFHCQKQLLVGRFFFLFALDLDLLALFALGLLDGLFDLDLLLRLLPLLTESYTALLHVVALDDLVVPEVLNFTLLVLLLLDNVELGLDTFSAHMLLSGSEGLELMRVAERVPHRCISVQDVLHALILDLHRLLLRNF